MDIRDIIRQIAKTGQPLGCLVCEVTAVDKAARTVDCQPVNEEAPVLGCNLQADQEATVGIVQFPRVGSYVLVAFSTDGTAGFVTLCEDVESVEVVIKDKQTASIVIDENGIVMNDGTLDGLIKINEMTDKLNNLVSEVNDFISTFNSHTHQVTVAHPGGTFTTVAPASTASDVSKFDKADYENEKVKQ